MDRYRCTSCFEECTIEEEIITYSGTHCTHGQSGVYRTGHYSSSCCGDEYVEYVEEEE